MEWLTQSNSGRDCLYRKKYKFWILDFGFWIGGIAPLYSFTKMIEYLKSKIRNPKSKIFIQTEFLKSKIRIPKSKIYLKCNIIAKSYRERII